MKILRSGDDVLVFGLLPLRDEIFRFLRGELGDEFLGVLFDCESAPLSIKVIQDRLRPHYEDLVRTYEDVLLNDESCLPTDFYDFGDHLGVSRINSKIQCIFLVRSLIELVNPDYKTYDGHA